MKAFLVLMMLTVAFSLSRCDKDEVPNPGLDKSVITNVEGPASGKIGQEIIFEVTLQGYNGCAISGELQENIDGTTRIIKGKVIYHGEACYQALVSIVKTYTFKASATGTYELKFLKVDNTFITHTINVIN